MPIQCGKREDIVGRYGNDQSIGDFTMTENGSREVTVTKTLPARLGDKLRQYLRPVIILGVAVFSSLWARHALAQYRTGKPASRHGTAQGCRVTGRQVVEHSICGR